MSDLRFNNKVILITGAGTGMGQAAALRLAREGACLVLVGRRAEPIETVAAEIQSEGGQALPIACDIGEQASVERMVQQIKTEFGRLDGVFANAGVLGNFAPLAETDASAFEQLLQTNLIGTFLTLRHCLPLLDGGAMLINASWTAVGVMPGTGAYAATKGALLPMMRTLAVELGPRNIRVNAINPGIILTPMAEEVLDPELAARLASHTPLGRNGTPQDISGTVAWLLSNDAAFVTGQEINVDGGYMIGGALR
jgi:NAD(P)-dependent dehydrogenase (short-subunit alcohol dehydrogenase family)